MFTDLLERIKDETVSVISKVQVRAEEDVQAVEQQRRTTVQMQFQHDEAPSATAAEEGILDRAPDLVSLEKISPHITRISTSGWSIPELRALA